MGVRVKPIYNLRELSDVFSGFLMYVSSIRGRSTGTVNGYYTDLCLFFRYVKIYRGLYPPETELYEIPINDLNEEFVKNITITEILHFIDYCKTDRDNNGATRQRKSTAIRAFFAYHTDKTNLLENNPARQLDSPKKKKALPKYLTLEQSVDLLNSVDGQFKVRDYCILTLFLNCGLRLSELCGLNLSDIRPDRSLRVVGKGDKERVVYLNQACMEAVNAYLRERPADGIKDKDALFISRHRQRIVNKTVQYIVKKYLKSIGMGAGYSVHKLRHTAATLMYQHGHVDIRVLKDVLGHENLGTTEIYTHLSSEQVKQALSDNPLSKLKVES
ncbi:MAG: tyrosine recombinase XerC [Oscillospiraceae bacterium]|jgi:site-specific recombinase XerD|nr:tyrosine recombinase XerC [Oscillospiraceae bacterium]